MHVCDIFNVKKVIEQRFSAGVHPVPDSVWIDQVQIVYVPEQGPVHLWLVLSLIWSAVSMLKRSHTRIVHPTTTLMID